MRSFLLITLVVTVAALGCIERHARYYTAASVQADECRDRYEIKNGGLAVLELYRIKGLPFPDAFSGFAVYVEIPESQLLEDTTFSVPGTHAQARLWILRAPQTYLPEVCTGTITIHEVKDERIVATLDLRSPEFEWNFKGKVGFHRTPVGPEG